MVGTLINVGTVLAGTTIGVQAGRRVPVGVQERVLGGIGLVTAALGIQLALQGPASSPLYVLGALLTGAVIGELLELEQRLERLGNRLEARFATGPHATISQAFVTATLLFCVGPLAIVGSLQDGLTGDYSTLATKSLLDGFAAIALAATLGWGVGLAACSVLVLQGSLTLGAGLLDPVLHGEPLQAITATGGLLVLGIALKLLGLRDLRVANYLPALVLAPAFVGLASLFR